MKYLKDFLSFIYKETEFKNESKKMTVLMRVLELFLVLFMVFSLLFCGLIGAVNGVFINLFFMLLFLLNFYWTYHFSRMVNVGILTISIVIWVTMSLKLYGWFCGIQTFLIPLVMIYYFSSYGKMIKKICYSLFVFIIYMGMYFGFSQASSMINFVESQRTILRCSNMAALIVCVSIIAYIFSEDSQNMEGKLIEYNQKLQEKANTDPLTGLYNRGRAMELLEDCKEKAVSENFSLCICDIDFFKKVNDNYGHDIGDEVLKAVAEILRISTDGEGYVARWGGEEFLLLYPNTNGDDAFCKISDIQNKIRNLRISAGEKEIRITMTFGLTEYNANTDLDSNVKDADKKLYLGKEGGRDRIVY